jgi:hypothetical protein
MVTASKPGRIREAMRRMGAHLLLGAITVELMAEVFTVAGVEHVLTVSLSRIVAS